MTLGQLNTTLPWNDLVRRMRENFDKWDVEWMRPNKQDSTEAGFVRVEFMHRGVWHTAECGRFGNEHNGANKNLHALLLAFEAIRKADQRGIAGVFTQVAQAFALPEGASDAHDVLGVGSGATADEIRTAYRAKLIKAHPDHGGTIDDLQKVRDAGRKLNVA